MKERQAGLRDKPRSDLLLRQPEVSFNEKVRSISGLEDQKRLSVHE